MEKTELTTEDRKKITAAIVAYNDYEEIKCAVSSMEEKTDPALNKLVYIVDNSTADLGEKNSFAEWLSRFGDVRYVGLPENKGFGGGHNSVLDNLDSEYHAIVNPDVIFHDDAFSKIVEFLDDNPDVGMCIPRLVDEEGKLQKCYRREITVLDVFIRQFGKGLFKSRYDYHTMQEMDYSKPFDVPFAQGSFLVIRTEILKKIGGFDERFFMYLEDADLCRRVSEEARVVYFPGAEVMHRWERGSHKDFKLKIQHYRSMAKYFGKWGLKFK